MDEQRLYLAVEVVNISTCTTSTSFCTPTAIVYLRPQNNHIHQEDDLTGKRKRKKDYAVHDSVVALSPLAKRGKKDYINIGLKVDFFSHLRKIRSPTIHVCFGLHHFH